MVIKWELIDNDCCQYIRKNGENFEMIQAQWMDYDDSYIVLEHSVNLKDYSEDEIRTISGFYDVEYEEIKNDSWMIAEFILEDEILKDCNIINEFDNFDEAKKFIEDFIKETIDK